MEKLKITIVLSCLIFLLGCSNQESKWKETKATNTISAYETFMKKFPDSKYINDARQFVEYEKQRLEIVDLINLAAIVVIKQMTQTGSIGNPAAPEFSGKLSDLISKYNNIKLLGGEIGGIEANLNGSSIKFSPKGKTSIKFSNPSYTIIFSGGEFGINSLGNEINYKDNLGVNVNGVDYIFNDNFLIKL